MATVGDLITIVSRRVRDPNNTGTSRANVRDLFSRCQQFVNTALESVLNTVSMTINSYQQVYMFTDAAPDIIKLKSVRQGSRDLSPIEFTKLRQISPEWYQRSGPRLETWATIGREMFVVHPALQSADTVSIVYIQQLPAFVTDNDVVNLPDDQIRILLRTVEAILLIKARDFAPIKDHLLPELVDHLKQARESITDMR